MLTAQISTLRAQTTLLLSPKILTNFQNITVNTALDRVAWDFSFTITSSVFAQIPFEPGNTIRIFADGEPILTGFIEVIRDTYTKNSHNVIVTGRSKTCDLVDSTVDGGVQFDSQVNLRTVAESLINNLFIDLSLPEGLQGVAAPEQLIKVVVESDITDFLTNENLSEDLGTTYFEVLEKFSRKRQVLMTTNGNGDLVFTRGKGSGSTNLILQNKVNNPNNNIESASYIRDHSKLFNTYSCDSQPSRGGFGLLEVAPPGSLVDSERKVIDDIIRPSRKLFFIAENASDGDQSGERAKWEGVTRRSRATVYNATVSGHSYNNEVWFINKPVSVVDDLVKVNGKMLLTNVTFKQDLTNGSTTKLQSFLKEAFVIPAKSLQDNSFFDLLYETTVEPIEAPFENLPEGPV
jgi:prophage tail gpP-like protein